MTHLTSASELPTSPNAPQPQRPPEYQPPRLQPLGRWQHRTLQISVCGGPNCPTGLEWDEDQQQFFM